MERERQERSEEREREERMRKEREREEREERERLERKEREERGLEGGVSPHKAADPTTSRTLFIQQKLLDEHEEEHASSHPGIRGYLRQGRSLREEGGRGCQGFILEN